MQSKAKNDIRVHVGCEHLWDVHRLVASAPSVAGPYGCEAEGCDCECRSDADVYLITTGEAERDHAPELAWLAERAEPELSAPHAAPEQP